MKPFQPSTQLLTRYAAVLVNFALNSGQGIKANEVVLCQVPDIAKPLALALQNTILKSGGQPIIRLLPTGFSRDYFNLAKNHQLTFFPKNYLKSQADLIDHQINIIAETDPFELKTIDPKKIFLKRDAAKLYVDWLTEKEVRNKYTWTIGLWGTEAKAKLVRLSLKAYWQQIIQACFLNAADPVKKWREVASMQKKILAKINSLMIQSVWIKGKEIDLKLTLGRDRIFNGGSGRNIPSFEVFTSPDWRGTEGWFFANQPLYRYGNLVKDIRLEFKAGQVIKAQAKIGNQLLQQMLKSPNADKLGEFSLTDKRMSRITHTMAETLFDENISGPFGNTHIAIGRAYKDCYRGNAQTMTAKTWAAKGFNDSPEHTDIISTSDRTVTATLANGVTKIIYQSGKFTL